MEKGSFPHDRWPESLPWLKLVPIMLYTLLAVMRNLVALVLRLALWPLFLIARARPAMLRIDLPASPPMRRAGRLARWLGRTELDLPAILELLHRARAERVVRGVVLMVPQMMTTRSVVAELREALDGVAAAGKEVVVVLREGGGLVELGLAPRGARVIVHPSAILRLSGPAAAPFFVGELLERLGVKADLLAVGEYKSAPESFTRTGISEQNREQLEALILDLEENAVKQVASARGVDESTVRGWVERSVFTPAEAVAERIVDEQRFDSQVIDDMKTRSRVADPDDRLHGTMRRLAFVPVKRPVHVAVISMRGQILPRSGPMPGSGQVLSDVVVPLIEDVGNDHLVKAIVLEIDSRGGSATASDAIYRRCVEAAGKKPVVAYLRDVAASGGYYIAAAAQDIVASPACITGSIGVFGGKIASAGAMERFGVSMTRITAGDPGAGLLLPDRPFDETEKELVLREMRAIYDTFVGVVAGRKGRPLEEVEPLARGRIWSAKRAQECGLVDAIGSWGVVRMTLAARLGCPEGRLRLVRAGRSDVLESLPMIMSAGAAVPALMATASLVARERVALEAPCVLSA